MRMGMVMWPLLWAWQLFLLSLVSAQSAVESDLRLVDGSTSAEGRLEIFNQGKWGTICNRQFKIEEAKVACNQLGYPYADGVTSFGEGSGQIVMKYVNCNGNENKLIDCYRDLDPRSCGHDDDVGVVCSNVQTTEAPPNIDPEFIDLLNLGKLRLVGGPDPYEGRVEVYVAEIRGWATFCSEFWNFRKAEVACKHLGYRPATSTGTARYGAGTGSIADCPVTGNRLKTYECTIINETDTNNTCTHDADVDIVCSGTEPGQQDQVRLVQGSSETEGRVEFYDQNVWKTPCSDVDWGIEEVQATCRQLGLPGPSSNTVPPGGTFGGNEEILQDSIACTGQERVLGNCARTPRPTACNTGDASVRCGTRQPAQEFDLRLVDGKTIAKGRVEMLYQGEWGTICSTLFYISEATVVCNQLGFQYAKRQDSFGKGNGKVLLDYVNCNGNEESVMDCYHVLSPASCRYGEDVGVVCSNRPTTRIAFGPFAGDIRLAGGPNPYEGRVEIYISDAIGWAGVCQENWDFSEAELVCQQLDYRPATSIGTKRYGVSSGPIALCQAEDIRVSSDTCQVINDGDSAPLCNPNTVVDIVCSGTERGYRGDIRLVNGTERTEGRIEIFHENVWWRVCADSWSLEEAKIACYQLGMPTPTQKVPGGMFGVNKERAFLPKTLNCSGEEREITKCLSTDPIETPCETGDAGLQCGVWKDAKEGDVRLSGTRDVKFGRLEIYNGTQWVVVCSTSWNKRKGHVACRQMGYLTDMSEFIQEFFSRTRLNTYWEDSRVCSGTEESLLGCMGLSGEPLKYCTYTNDVRSGCDPRPRADSLQVRLVNGLHPNQGIVEVEYNGQWGTICDHGWDAYDAQVICRQLGFGEVVAALDGYDTRKVYEARGGAILFYSLGCEGPETNISDCYYEVPRYGRCNHNYDVSVVCESEDYPSTDPRIKATKPPGEEGLSSDQIRNIVIGVLAVVAVCCSACWACLKWLAKPESNAGGSVGVTEASGGANQYQEVKQGEDLAPKYDEVTSGDPPAGAAQTAV